MKTFPAVRKGAPDPEATEPGESPPSVFDDVKRRFGNTDLSAFAACRELQRLPAPITGQQMAEAIFAGAHDKAGHATPSELREFQRFSYAHPGKLTHEASEVLSIYEHAMATAIAKGETAINNTDFVRMVTEISTLTASRADRSLAALDQTTGPVSAPAMTKAILTGIRDRDGNSTGRELAQFEDWAKRNRSRLTFGAQQVLAILHRTLTAALQRGQKGLTSTEFAYLAMKLREVKTPASY